MKTNPDNATDTLGNLGAPIKTTKPAAAPVPVAPGIVKNADGKLETRINPPQPTWSWQYGIPVVPGVPVVHQDDEQAED